MPNPEPTEPAMLRLCYGALHLVMQDDYQRLGHRLAQPGAHEVLAEQIDWTTTMRLRTALDQRGIGVAEAMDTAQRFQIGWPAARRLISECGALRLANGFCAGAGTDQLATIRHRTDLVDAVVEQCHYIRSHGGIAVILPMPWLVAQGAGERDYVEVYAAIIRQVEGPVFVHWLGEMFLPALRGYFPGQSFAQVMALDPGVVRGCKLSLLDAELEVRVRAELLPREQIVLTGDDFHFAQMLLGDGQVATATTTIGSRTVALGNFSHALLGIFDAIALPTQRAMQRLAAGDTAGFLAIMTPCEQLGQHVFAAPTQHYKAGLAFLAWLNGLQPNFLLANHEQLARDRAHYLRAAELARLAGAVLEPARFEQRLSAFAGSPWPPAG